MKNNRYLVFAGTFENSIGGLHDLKGSVDKLEDLEEFLEGIEYEWYDVLDLVTGEEVR